MWSSICEAVRLAEERDIQNSGGRRLAFCLSLHFHFDVHNEHGDCLAAKLRPGNVQNAGGWEELLLPGIERLKQVGKEVAFRGDATLARPEVYEALEERGVKYAIRILDIEGG